MPTQLREIRSVAADLTQGELVIKAVNASATETEIRVGAPAVPALIAGMYEPAARLANALLGPSVQFQLFTLRKVENLALHDGRSGFLLVLDNGFRLPILGTLGAGNKQPKSRARRN
jgi:hypothetical protein